MPAQLHTWIPRSEIERPIWTTLCTEQDFWKNFFADLKTCIRSIIVISPFLANEATWRIINEFKVLKQRGVQITIFTRPANEHTNVNSFNLAINRLKTIGAEIKIVSKLHQKIAIIDHRIWWEGSLNILSFRSSREHMRRFEGQDAVTILQDIGLA